MPLTWNEIKDRARRFSLEWADEASEEAEAKSFWDVFFHVFGVSRQRVASFEKRIKKLDGKDGYIDLLWKGVLLIYRTLTSLLPSDKPKKARRTSAKAVAR